MNRRRFLAAKTDEDRHTLLEKAQATGNPLRGVAGSLRIQAGLEAAEQFAAYMSGREDITPRRRVLFDRFALELRLWRTGQWRAVRAELDKPWEDFPEFPVIHGWYMALSPMGPLLSAELGDLKEQLIRSRPNWDWTEGEVWKGQEDVVLYYSLATLSLKMGDEAGLAKYRDTLTALAAEQGRDGFGPGLVNSLESLMAGAAGDYELANEKSRQATFPWWFHAGNDWYTGRIQIRHMLAGMLMEQGRFQEALPLIESLERSHGMYQVPSYLYRAQCYEGLGEIEKAVEFYTRFVDHWKDADPELQPMVEEARAGLARLLDGQVREPES